MRKYILTDRDGHTAQGQHLTAGKFVQRDHQHKDVLSMVSGCCGDTPLLATLLAPFPSREARLFQINCWNISVDKRQTDSYTVIKEVTPVPPVSLEHRMRFALTALQRAFHNPDFRQWAANWLVDTDRTKSTAESLKKKLGQEQMATDELEVLAAWGESGDSNHMAQDLDEQLHSALHAIQAVVLYADSAPEIAIGRELAAALGNVSVLGGKEALSSLADQLLINLSDPEQVRETG